MINVLPKTLISLWICVCSCQPAFGLTASEHIRSQPTNTFYNNGAEGWYWYHDPAQELQLPEEPRDPPHEKPLPAPPKPSGSEPFSLKWIQEMLPKYQELAWNQPTHENVQAYFLVQRFAMDRANKFSDVAQQVVVGNALLDETMRRPLATFANMQVDRTAAQNTDELLKKVAKKAGLFFFFKSDCRYCEAQAPLIGHLEDMGFNVLAVSIDGGSLLTRQFKDTRVDSGQAEALGVSATPALFLMNDEGTFTALGQTVLSFSELRRRILLVATREGWIDEKDLKETQPLLNPNNQFDLSEELPKLLHASTNSPVSLVGRDDHAEVINQLSQPQVSQLVDENNFIAPNKLIDLFGKRAKTSGQAKGDDEQ